MRRRLFIILPVLSLLLCGAVVALWAESYVHNRGFVRLSPGASHYAVESTNGRIGLFCVSPLPAGVTASSVRADVIVMRATTDGVVPVQKADRVLAVPYWSVVGLVLLPCGIWALAYQRHRRADFRRTHSLCLQCSYDLRASEERCPECGKPIPTQSVLSP